MTAEAGPRWNLVNTSIDDASTLLAVVVVFVAAAVARRSWRKHRPATVH
jgi:hypothetical protein